MRVDGRTDGSTESVVLLADDGTPIGTAPKHTVHGHDTPLHLAFSCHVRDTTGLVLVTRRALHKRAFPGVWSNAFCGHPLPGEPIESAVHRRAQAELGARLTGVRVALPEFRYRAVDAGGIVEHELCPVYTAVIDEAHGDSAVAPDPSEVADYRWVTPSSLETAVEAAPWAFSPWLVLQLAALSAVPQ